MYFPKVLRSSSIQSLRPNMWQTSTDLISFLCAPQRILSSRVHREAAPGPAVKRFPLDLHRERPVSLVRRIQHPPSMSNLQLTSPKSGNMSPTAAVVHSKTRNLYYSGAHRATDNVSVCRTLMMLQWIQNPKQKCCQTGARHLLLGGESFPWAVRWVFCFWSTFVAVR